MLSRRALLIYLPAAGDSTDIAVDKLVITPPNDLTHAELTWHQSVLLQDGATRPGTYISPVMPGADRGQLTSQMLCSLKSGACRATVR